MSIYTCFDMIADCKADKSEGWAHLVKTFVPVLRGYAAHYGMGDEWPRRRLGELRSEISGWEPMTEREVAVRLRPEIEGGSTTVPLEALNEMTIVEKELVWFETMQYDAAHAARMMRVTGETAQRARDLAEDLLRANMDDWHRGMLREQGAALGREVRSQKPAEPLTFRQLIEVIDGRLTWQARVPVERALESSWYEIDHFCRIREADDVVGSAKSLSDEEAAPFLDLLGVERKKASLWRKVFAS
ncbi:MAG: hypothetical protein U0Q16_07255 [Bryobacteraceae bacterium]